MTLNLSQQLFSSLVFCFSFDLNQVFSAQVYKRPCIQTSAWTESFPPGVNEKVAVKMASWVGGEMFTFQIEGHLLLPLSA